MISPGLPNSSHSTPSLEKVIGPMRFGSAALKISTFAVAWLSVVLTGGLLLAHYSQTAGAMGTPPAQWPETSRAHRQSGHSQLVMFLHPRCPCSRATLGELEQLVAHCPGKFSTQVWFIQPEGMDDAWVKTDLWHAAASIPGVQVNIDHEGEEARRFQAVTSGQTLLYGADGGLVFQGGITLARGHAGDNPGRDAIESLLKQKIPPATSSPVFGCALGWGKTQKECTACQP
ncbi:RedB protein [Prosthecobacter sp.]|uniref:RedB protein n=1 Tax=Prosthecobacter sp. TaxID=1965333 RepID=UPI0037830AF2